MVETVVDLAVLRVRIEGVADVGHFGDCGLKVGVHADAHRSVDGGTETGRIVDVRT